MGDHVQTTGINFSHCDALLNKFSYFTPLPVPEVPRPNRALSPRRTRREGLLAVLADKSDDIPVTECVEVLGLVRYVASGSFEALGFCCISAATALFFGAVASRSFEALGFYSLLGASSSALFHSIPIVPCLGFGARGFCQPW